LWNGKSLSPVTPELKWDVSGFAIDLQRTHIVYGVNEGGFSKTFVLNAKTLKPEPSPKFPNADHVSLGLMSRNGKNVMVSVDTGKGPRTSYAYNFANRSLTQWVLPSQPEMNTADFSRATLEYYKSRDGVMIPMFVRRPPQCSQQNQAAPCPVVVEFHGGPEGQSLAGFNAWAQLFVDEGIIFVQPNVRGSDGYGKTWFHSDDGEKRLKVITDIEDAALFIKKEWAQNGKAPKVGAVGWSYGGYSTLIAMTMFAGSFDAGVSLVGIGNLETFLNNTAPYRRSLRIAEYGDPVKDKDALVKLSPMTYLSQVKNPLMIVQGATDPRVPVGEALQMHQALQAKNIPSSLIIFANEGHGTKQRANKVLELGHTLNFLKTHLR
jgi:dipeptidyl aminopeptidase/acylaminoacyl peptidase